MEQFLLALFTISSMWLTQDKDQNVARYACIVGMCAQPFWFYSVFSKSEIDWGVFAVCCFCTFTWFRGIVNNWLPQYYADRIRQTFLKVYIKL